MEITDIVASLALVLSVVSTIAAFIATKASREINVAEKRTMVVAKLSEARFLINKITYEMQFLIDHAKKVEASLSEVKKLNVTDRPSESFKLSANMVEESGLAIDYNYNEIISNKKLSIIELEDIAADLERIMFIAKERIEKIKSYKSQHNLKF